VQKKIQFFLNQIYYQIRYKTRKYQANIESPIIIENERVNVTFCLVYCQWVASAAETTR